MALLTDKDLEKLQIRMVFYWDRFVLVATGLAAASLVCILLPLKPAGPQANLVQASAIWVGVAVIFFVIHFAAARRRERSLCEQGDNTVEE